MTDNRQKNKADNSSSEDAFWLTDLYPDAEGLLIHEHRSLSEIKDDCIVALDANALLFPLEFTSESVSAVEKVYTQLTREERLIVPAQAVREFYKHRSRKISEIVEALDAAIKKAKKQIFEKKIPILESDEDYKEAQAIGRKIINDGKDLEIKLISISQKLKDGIGTDPVSIIYRRLLGGSICDFEFTKDINREKFIEEVSRRARLHIAPGFKDQNKEDGGVGDYLIWTTILQEAKRTQKHCIFVTEEEKADWWIKKHGTFQPRPELIDEYRRASGGKSLHLIPLSGLLLQFKAKKQVVEQIQELEKEQKQNFIFPKKRRIIKSSSHNEKIRLLEEKRRKLYNEFDNLRLTINKILNEPDNASSLDLYPNEYIEDLNNKMINCANSIEFIDINIDKIKRDMQNKKFI